MSADEFFQQDYRQQLVRLVDAMALPRREDAAAAALEASSSLAAVKMFVAGNLEKRCEKLERQVAFLQPAFSNLETLIIDYIFSTPLAAYDTGVSDGERLLAWLGETKRLTKRQKDYVACQRARHAVEEHARRRRLEYVRFQELHGAASALAPELGANESLRIHLNPTRAWTRFLTRELLDEDAEPPCDVLFFAIRGEISSAVLEDEGRAIIEELAGLAPCALDAWASVSTRATRDELAELCGDLAEMGLAAFS